MAHGLQAIIAVVAFFLLPRLCYAEATSCVEIEDSVERLACYDAAAGRSRTSSAKEDSDKTLYDFRGYRLGVTIEEFRNIPFPDIKEYPSARAVCTNDKEQKSSGFDSPRLNASGLFGHAGVVICAFYAPYKDIYLKDSTSRKNMSYLPKEELAKLSEINPDFAGLGRQRTTFMFTPSTIREDLAGRLFYISVSLRNRDLNEVLAALRAKYGNESRKSMEKFKIKSGAEFDNIVVVWINELSSITVKQFSDHIDMMSVTYVHKDLILAAQQAADEAAKILGRKL